MSWNLGITCFYNSRNSTFFKAHKLWTRITTSIKSEHENSTQFEEILMFVLSTRFAFQRKVLLVTRWFLSIWIRKIFRVLLVWSIEIDSGIRVIIEKICFKELNVNFHQYWYNKHNLYFCQLNNSRTLL